jgi:hypothetical protein
LKIYTYLLKNKYFIAAAATNNYTAIAGIIIIVPSLENIIFIIGYRICPWNLYW